jgi:rsbT co-antagonist protein RsbR
VVDTEVAKVLVQVVRAARLLGSEVILVGIRPEVAQAIVGLGLTLEGMVTYSNLQSGLQYAL